MAGTDMQATAEALAETILDLSTRLHDAIRNFDESEATYAIAGPPGLAFFRRDETDTVSHVSGSPSPELMPMLDDLHRRHLDRVGVAPEGDNSHVPPLVLLCMMLHDSAAAERLDLHSLARKPTEISALTEDEARHDPELRPHDAALRAWVPLASGHAPDAGVHPSIVEFRFHLDRTERYAPW